jgi:hypothetical protein
MPKTPKKRIAADEIADKATRGEDVSAYFMNRFTVVGPRLQPRSAVLRVDDQRD